MGELWGNAQCYLSPGCLMLSCFLAQDVSWKVRGSAMSLQTHSSAFLSITGQVFPLLSLAFSLESAGYWFGINVFEFHVLSQSWQLPSYSIPDLWNWPHCVILLTLDSQPLLWILRNWKSLWKSIRMVLNYLVIVQFCLPLFSAPLLFFSFFSGNTSDETQESCIEFHLF